MWLFGVHMYVFILISNAKKKYVHHSVEMHNRSLDALPTHSRTVFAYLIDTTCNYILHSRLVGLPHLCELCAYRCVCVGFGGCARVYLIILWLILNQYYH